MNHLKKLLHSPHRIPLLGGIIAAVVAAIALLAVLVIQAATGSIILSAANFSTTEPASLVDDSTASEGRALLFGAGASVPGIGQIEDHCKAMGGSTLTVGNGGQYSSINEAANAARPGDLVMIAGGTYGRFDVPTSGAPDQHITFCGKPGEDVIITGGSGRGLLAVTGKSWLKFVNLTVKGSSNFGVYADGSDNLVFNRFEVDGSQDGGLIVINGSQIIVDGCDIHGTNARDGASHEALSMADNTTDFVVKNCKVHDNGEEGIDAKYSFETNGKIHNNVVWNCNGPNIYLDGVSNVEVYNNISYGARGSSKAGIGIAGETTYGDTGIAQDIKIYNNVLYDNAGGGIDFYTESGGRIQDVSIYNNTIVDNPRGAIRVNTGSMSGSNPVFNNILSGDVASDPFQIGNNFTGDPQFVNPGAGDYRLQPGSPAIDAGTSDGAPAFDLEGTSRPQGDGIDMGAYEQ